jgi:acetolactate synthase-1/2/3 large subunit
MTRESLTGGEIIVRCLEQMGADYIFGMCGHSVAAILGALEDSRLTFISTRHESIASHAADGYFKAGHKPALVLTHVGPGLTNAVTGVVHASLDCTPMIVIAGEVPTYRHGQESFQELNMHADASQHEIYRPFVKRAWRVGRIELLPYVMARAFNTAMSGRSGPVLISVPMDILSGRAEVDVPNFAECLATGPRVRGDIAEIAKAAELLVQAERPAIFAGGGTLLAEASEELTELAHDLAIPVTTGVMGKGVFSEEDPLAMGVTGIGGTSVANQTTLNADALLAIGTRFNEHDTCSWDPQHTFAIPPTKLIQIDIEPSEIGNHYPTEIGIVGDAKAVLSDLLEAVREATPKRDWQNSSWARDRVAEMTRWREEAAQFQKSDAIPIHPLRVMYGIREVLPKDGLVVTDTSTSKSIATSQMVCYVPRTLITAGGGLATMGFGPPAALGVKLAYPQQPVIAITGDGGFTVLPQSLATAVEHDIQVIWVILNNYGYISIRNIQKKYADSTYGTEFRIKETGGLYNPDFVRLAQAYGAKAKRIEKPDEIGPALREALDAQVPYVLDVIVDTEAPLPRYGAWDAYGLLKGVGGDE